MDLTFHTVDDLPGDGTYLVRVDVNSPLDEDDRPAGRRRFQAHLETLRDLEDAACVLLAHQGRPGQADCVSLAPHAGTFADLLGRDVRHVADLFGEPARKAVRDAGPGDLLVLENTRMYAEEKDAPGPANPIVRSLAPLVDGYVNDAFAAAHRADTSLVGFPPVLPSAAGRLMEREVRALGHVVQEPEPPSVLVLGGAKVDDAVAVAERMLDEDRADELLTGGAVANLFLQASGTSVGAPNWGFIRSQVPDAEQVLKRARALLDRHGDRIHLPEDVALADEGDRVEVSVDELPVADPIHDLGPRTVEAYRDVVGSAGTIVVNGPPGVFEHPDFADGTRELFQAIADSPGYSLAGGGHTGEAIEELGIVGFDHVSTGGGASMAFLSGRPMPALAALREAARDDP